MPSSEEELAELRASLRQLAQKWIAQARHPQRMARPEEKDLIMRHVEDLEAVRRGEPFRGQPEPPENVVPLVHHVHDDDSVSATDASPGEGHWQPEANPFVPDASGPLA
jgi:hypothetical protein